MASPISAALFRSGLVGRRGLHASFLLVAASPSPSPSRSRSRSAAAPAAAPAAAFGALACPIWCGNPRRLRRGARDPGAEGDLVLAVVELGEVDQALVSRLDHEFREARESHVLLVERGI